MDWNKIGESAIDTGLGFLSSVGTGLINNALSQSNAEHQRDWQEKMWHMQNLYNSPVKMAARMRDVGLNPYTMTGAQPAGSAGQGAMAQTIPIESPLAALRTMAEIRNINASTNVEESTVEKILRESELIRIGVERGLIDNEQAKKLIEEMWEAYEAAGYSGPTGFNIKQGETQMSNLNQQIAESQQRIETLLSEQNYNEALTATENLIRDARKAREEALTDEAKATAQNQLAQAYLSRVRAQYEPLDAQADRDLKASNKAEIDQSVKEMQETYSMRLRTLANELKVSISNEKIAEFNAKVREAVERLGSNDGFLLFDKQARADLNFLIANALADASVGVNVSPSLPNVPPPSKGRIGY